MRVALLIRLAVEVAVMVELVPPAAAVLRLDAGAVELVFRAERAADHVRQVVTFETQTVSYIGRWHTRDFTMDAVCSRGFRGGPSRLRPLGDGLTPSLTITLASAIF